MAKLDVTDGTEMHVAMRRIVEAIVDLQTKAEDLGGFESLARISKLEVDLAAVFDAVDERDRLLQKRITELETTVSTGFDVRFARRLLFVGLAWLAVTTIGHAARIFIAWGRG